MALSAPSAPHPVVAGSRRALLAGRLGALVPDAAAIGFLLALTLVFYWRILIPDPANRASFPRGDFYDHYYAFAYFRAQELGAGRLPLWYPHAYGGGPFLADIQSAVFYAPGWLTTLVALPRGYPVVALEAEVVAHIFLAGALTYLFARRVFRSPPISGAQADDGEAVERAAGRFLAPLTAAVVFAFGGYLASYPPLQVAILEAQVWLPLILLCLHSATEPDLTQPRRLAWSAGAALALGLSILAGHPQSAMYVLYGTLAYTLHRLACRAADAGHRAALAEALPVLLSLPLGLAIAAAQLVPTVELMRLSTRAAASYSFTWWGFPLRDLLQILLPGSVSLWSPMYIGLVPLGLAGLALWRRPAREIGFWAGLAVGALLLSFGGHTVAYSFLYLLAPGFGLFRDQERAVYLFSFAMAMLAGSGMRVWLMSGLAPDRLRPGAQRFLVAALVLFVALAALSATEAAGGKTERLVAPSAFLVILAGLVAGLIELRRRGITSRAIGGLTVALIVFDLFTVSWQTNVLEVPPQAHFAPTPVTRALQAEVGDYRAHNHFQLPLNYGAVYGIEDVLGESPLQIKRYRDLREALPRERFWTLLHVKYLITWESSVPNATRLASAPTPADPKKETHLHRLPEPNPRAFVAHAAVVADGEDALALLASDGFDLRRQVVLAQAPSLPLPGGEPSPATVVERHPDRIAVETAPDRPGILTLSEVDYPGWRATVDGRPAPVVRVNYVLRGVPLPPGQHRVELVFDPLSVKLGIAITALALVGTAAALVGLWLLPRRRPTENP
ncbi:MAG: YfhO family protein [Chloroflexi bacterium]|nr:YfhO family protein [Chloroflexota bacterium]